MSLDWKDAVACLTLEIGGPYPSMHKALLFKEGEDLIFIRGGNVGELLENALLQQINHGLPPFDKHGC